MTTICIDRTAVPYTFQRDGQTKFGLQHNTDFIWITQILDTTKKPPFQTVTMPIKNPVGKEIITNTTTDAELEARGLNGFSLEFAKQWTNWIK